MSDAKVRGPQAGEAVSAGPAEPGAGVVTSVRPARRWPAGWLAAVIPALAELIVGGYRIGVPSLWRDEAATISGSQRSLSAIMTMARHQDAVHAPYYVLMHAVIAVGGTSPTALRIPSLIAMSLAVGVTGALGRRLARVSGLPGATAVGLLAGLALTALPLTTRYAQEARPYALATLCSVVATYVFVVALASPRWRWWVLYAVSLLLTGLFSLFAVLLAVAHGGSLIWLSRVRHEAGQDRSQAEVTGVIARRWLASCVAVAALLGPLAAFSAGQSSQLSWVRQPTPGTLASLARDFAGTTALIPVVVVAALLGCATGLGAGGGRRSLLAAIALPWLAVPPVLLLAVSFIHPYYVERYVLFCLPALAVLVAAGLVWLVTLTGRALAGRGLRPRLAVLAAVPSGILALLIVALLIGPQGEIRTAGNRPDNLAAAAAVLAGHERPGDVVLYLPRGTSVLAMAYPRPFRHVRDIGLGTSPVASGTLRGLAAPAGTIASRLAHVRRVWSVEWVHPLDGANTPPSRLTGLLARWRLIGRWHVQSLVLRLYAASR